MSKSVNENAMKLNRIKPGTNVLFNILFVILAQRVMACPEEEQNLV